MGAYEQSGKVGLSLRPVLGRYIGGVLYALSLLFIAHDLLAAVLILLAGLAFLPSTCALLRKHTRMRVNRAHRASTAAVLLIGAGLSVGWTPAPVIESATPVSVQTVSLNGWL
jgi:cytochrome c biogenesis protein CcdA